MTISANQLAGMQEILAPIANGAEAQTRAYVTVSKAITDGGTAGTDALISPIASFPASEFPNGVKVISASFQPSVAVTGADATAKTIAITSLTSAGASSVAVGSIVTNLAGGNIVANAAAPVTLTAANCIVPVGGTLCATMTHAGAGMAIASATGPALLTVTVQVL